MRSLWQKIGIKCKRWRHNRRSSWRAHPYFKASKPSSESIARMPGFAMAFVRTTATSEEREIAESARHLNLGLRVGWGCLIIVLRTPRNARTPNCCMFLSWKAVRPFFLSRKVSEGHALRRQTIKTPCCVEIPLKHSVTRMFWGCDVCSKGYAVLKVTLKVTAFSV